MQNRVNLDNIAPATWLSYPATGTDLGTFAAGEQLPVQAEATDNGGVAAVLFYLDHRLLGRRDGAPWTLMLAAGELRPGPHRLEAVAVDAAGNRSPPRQLRCGAKRRGWQITAAYSILSPNT